MSSNVQSRKWMLTIHNPLEAGLSQDVLKEIMLTFSPSYFCMADEISKAGSYHTHVFIYSKSPIRFSTIKKRISIAHIDKAYGTVKENVEYVQKTGKWKMSEKAVTSVKGSFFKFGIPPTDKEESNPEMFQCITRSRRATSAQ